MSKTTFKGSAMLNPVPVVLIASKMLVVYVMSLPLHGPEPFAQIHL